MRLGERIAKLEEGVTGLEKGLIELRDSVAADTRAIFRKIDDLVIARRPQWGTIATAVGVIVAIIAGLAQGPLGVLERHDRQIDGLSPLVFLPQQVNALDSKLTLEISGQRDMARQASSDLDAQVERLRKRIEENYTTLENLRNLWMPRIARLEAFEERKEIK